MATLSCAFTLPSFPRLPSLPSLPAVSRPPRFPFASDLPSFPETWRRRVKLPTLHLSSGAAPPPPPPPPPYSKSTSDGDHSSSNPFSFYLALLNSYPLRTKIITSGIITAIADVFAQMFENRSVADPKFHRRRIFAMFLDGAFVTAPLCHYLYAFLERQLPSTSARNIFLQVVVDQALLAPVWLALFLPFVSIMEGQKNVFNGFKSEFRDGLLTTWTIFPAVQVVNFAYVPVQYRVLVVNAADLLLTAALSFIKHRPKDENEQTD